VAPPIRNPLIVALDVPELADARAWAQRLAGEVGLFKVGLELFAAAGPDAVRAVSDAGRADVFLDLKLHDIPATVERASRAVRRSGARLLTVHAAGGKAMLEAAVQGAGDDVCVLVVTRLTSLPASESEVAEAARLAREAGCGGVVCSGLEARTVRAAVGPERLIVCPGVRPPGAEHGDQVRVATPESALRDGADYLVVGRPVLGAADPVAAARAIAGAGARS